MLQFRVLWFLCYSFCRRPAIKRVMWCNNEQFVAKISCCLFLDCGLLWQVLPLVCRVVTSAPSIRMLWLTPVRSALCRSSISEPYCYSTFAFAYAGASNAMKQKIPLPPAGKTWGHHVNVLLVLVLLSSHGFTSSRRRRKADRTSNTGTMSLTKSASN